LANRLAYGWNNTLTYGLALLAYIVLETGLWTGLHTSIQTGL